MPGDSCSLRHVTPPAHRALQQALQAKGPQGSAVGAAFYGPSGPAWHGGGSLCAPLHTRPCTSPLHQSVFTGSLGGLGSLWNNNSNKW